MKRNLPRFVAAVFAGCLVGAAHGQEAWPPVAWEVTEGVQSPESVYYDAEADCLFVSQIGQGGPTGKDQDGYLSRLGLDGQVLQARWVTGLNAPKGLRSSSGRLWLSDIDQIVQVDIAEGKIAARIPVDGAQFLNDVACDAQGTVYVSDMMGNKIYRCRDGKVDVFAEGEMLEYPNGLLVVGDRLVVASWGKPKEDFSTDVPGRLFSLDLKTGDKTLITPEPLGNLDGLETVAEGRYLVTDWNAGKVFYVAPDGKARSVLELPKGAADIGYVPEKRLLVVPQMLENKLTAYSLVRPQAGSRSGGR